MRKLTLVVSVLVIAFLGFAAVASAQEAIVFGNGVLIRAYITGSTAPYSAYLEVRDDQGIPVPNGQFYVDGIQPTADPANNSINPVQIHNNDLTNADISISYDSATKTVYVLCINAADGTTPHVMTYDIGLTSPPPPAPVNGACGPSNGGSFTGAPTSGLCSAGTATVVSGSGPWTWNCLGSNGGTDANCSAQIQTSGLPDLTVSVMSWPSAYNVGTSFNINVTVRNQGVGAAGPSNVKVYQSGSVVGAWSVGGLSAGGSASASVSVSPNSSCSIHTWCDFTVKADADTQVKESSESNNSSTRSLYRGR